MLLAELVPALAGTPEWEQFCEGIAHAEFMFLQSCWEHDGRPEKSKGEVADWRRCVACGMEVRHEYFMVKPHIWYEVMPSFHSGQLHILCFEQKLGRELCAADFTGACCNDPAQSHGMSEVFRDRVQRAQKEDAHADARNER